MSGFVEIPAWKLASKVISVKQPWAWLIAEGWKDFENRSQWTSFAGNVFIHAGKNIHDDVGRIRRWVRRKFKVRIPDLDDLETGGIVGVAKFGPAVQKDTSPWFFGPYAYPILEAWPLPLTPMKGALGFFRPPLMVNIDRELYVKLAT